jgi:hypothetical protein
VMQKLNVKGRSQAVVELIRLGELKIWPLVPCGVQSLLDDPSTVKGGREGFCFVVC